MERIWLKSYPEGVPTDIDLAGRRTRLIVSEPVKIVACEDEWLTDAGIIPDCR